MTDHVTIDGHKIELQETPEGMMTTDVIILRRVIDVAPDGQVSDMLMIDHTPQTSWILQTGILAAATEETSYIPVIGDDD